MLKQFLLIFVHLLLMFLFNNNFVYAKSFSFLKSPNEVKLITKPSWLVIKETEFYDAEEDDLVTAGIGFSTLSHALTMNKFANIQKPTLHELRKAKFNRFIDKKTGEGTLFGFRTEQLTPLFDGRIPGTEVQAYLDNDGVEVTFLLQIPLDFDQKKPCIVAVPTIDSQGIYNATDMQIRGLWGLNHNCAVVYNDKGLGDALFDLKNQQGYFIDGTVSKENKGKDKLIFSVNNKLPANLVTHRYAIKQLHSQQNPEHKWGEYVINSLEFAFYYLNSMYSTNNEIIFDKDNTIVLVYGATDGGGAALKAGEFDTTGMIDGIVAVNPQIQVLNNQEKTTLFIQRGESPEEPFITKSLIDYTTYGAIYIPCAISAIQDINREKTVPYVDKYFFTQNRCQSLKEAHLLTSETVEEQSYEALEKLYQYGWSPQMINQLPFYYYTQSINLPYKYISQYGQYTVKDHLCHLSVASINQELIYNDGNVAPLNKTNFALLWADNTGSLPIRMSNNIIAIDTVNDDDPNGPHGEFYSRSKNSNQIDYNLAGALCLREKVTDSRVENGQQQVFANGNLHGIKTIIVHGQLNVKNLPDYSARAYAALNSYTEGKTSNLRYIEVENASYIDSVMPFDNSLIPIDYYGDSAMDWLWSNITKQTSLPDSQVIRTVVRGGIIGDAPPVTELQLVPIAQTSKTANRIDIQNAVIRLPKPILN